MNTHAPDLTEAELSQAIGRIQDAIRIPGVSKTGQNLSEMARWVGASLEELGAKVSFHDGQVAPIVEGLLTASPLDTTRPRLLFYTLYDVQPASEEGWSSPPFAAEIVTDNQGRRQMIGRGAFNSKGPLVGFISAVRILQERGIPLPVDIHFVIEGEEEIGSPSLRPFIEQNKARFQDCDGVLIPYLGTAAGGETPIRLGFKGLCFIEFSVEGGDWGGPARRDLHALHNGWVASPTWELLRALTTLKGPDGALAIDNLTVPDWWSANDTALVNAAADQMDAATIREDLGIVRFAGTGTLADHLKRLMDTPTLNIDGIEAGHIPPGGLPATQMPRCARAYADLRFTPGMEPEQTLREIRSHLDAHGFGHVQMTVHNAYPASRSDPQEPVVSALVGACREISDRVILLPIHAGAAPLYLFSDILGIPYAFGGLGHGGRSHAPDEYLDVDSMADYMRAMIAFLFRFGQVEP